MCQIRPSITPQDIICKETTSPANGLVVFGASGDLAHRKLFVSLFELSRRRLLNENFYLLGVGRKKLSDQTFRSSAHNVIVKSVTDLPAEKIDDFVNKFYYISGNYNDSSLYTAIKGKLAELDIKHNIDTTHIFYLSVPPSVYPDIAQQLCSSGLSSQDGPACRQKPRLVVEKPFGRDLQSAIELSNKIQQCFDESQVYRIDHYLGKETVQNILMFRFANAIFEPVWNRNYIDHIQITIAESIGIEHRSRYYDKAGALRDMFQNHMLQMLALAAMEPPISFKADHIRNEKVKLFNSIRRFEPNLINKTVVRGQYTPGSIKNNDLIGYRQEPGVQPNSKTETFVAAKLCIHNWRWTGVPFYLRTGKRLKCKNTEIAIFFKKVPHSMFVSAGLTDLPSNVLVLQIQPHEGISLSLQAKKPGSKICMGTLNMQFSYKDVFGIAMPQAYQRLLLDCMLGDQTLFTRADAVEATWELLTPVLQAWEKEDSMPFEYPAGAESFPAADSLIESDGRKWRRISTI